MNKSDYVRELENELNDSRFKLYANADDSISVYGEIDDVSIFFTIPVDFQSIENDAKKIVENKEIFKKFFNSLTPNLHNLSIDVTLNKLD
ncbi:MAG: hypothetical protein MJY85_07185 [Fibrobacter sp.]|nr:hypothetical protein [Fibrobacter sp.]MCQ2092448.1 hypothetical protein [Fibrobacter sp.]